MGGSIDIKAPTPHRFFARESLSIRAPVVLRAASAALTLLSMMAANGPAAANPLGTETTLGLTNIGGCVAAMALPCETGQPIAVDGAPHAVPGTSLTFSVDATSNPTILAAAFGYVLLANPLGSGIRIGPNPRFDLIETSGVTSAPDLRSTVPVSADPSGFVLGPFQDTGPGARGTGFIYFALNGVVRPISDVFDFGLKIGPHPFDPSIPGNVLYTAGGGEEPGMNALIVDTGAFGVSLATLAFALNLGQFNEVHAGFLTEPVPVPLLAPKLLVVLASLLLVIVAAADRGSRMG